MKSYDLDVCSKTWHFVGWVVDLTHWNIHWLESHTCLLKNMIGFNYSFLLLFKAVVSLVQSLGYTAYCRRAMRPSIVIEVLLLLCMCMCVVNVNTGREAPSVGGVCDAACSTHAVLTQVKQSAASRVVWREDEERHVDAWSGRDTTSDAGTAATDDVDVSAGAGSPVTAPRRPVMWSQSQSHCLLTQTVLCTAVRSITFELYQHRCFYDVDWTDRIQG